MNPLTNMKNVLKLSERDLQRGGKSSWHDMYRNSAWIFVGGMPFDLSEGDIIAVFSQYGEIVNINLVRDKLSGKSKGFCFICYEDQRSTILAVDNLNGIKILNRSLRVDHVADYKPPKESDRTDEETRRLYMEGCAPKPQLPEESIKREQDKTSGSGFKTIKKESDQVKVKTEKSKKSKREKKEKKAKKEKKSKKKKRKKIETNSSDENSSGSESSSDSESDTETRKSKHRSRSRSPQKRKPENRFTDRGRNDDRREKRRSHSRSRDNERRRRSRSR